MIVEDGSNNGNPIEPEVVASSASHGASFRCMLACRVASCIGCCRHTGLSVRAANCRLTCLRSMGPGRSTPSRSSCFVPSTPLPSPLPPPPSAIPRFPTAAGDAALNAAAQPARMSCGRRGAVVRRTVQSALGPQQRTKRSVRCVHQVRTEVRVGRHDAVQDADGERATPTLSPIASHRRATGRWLAALLVSAAGKPPRGRLLTAGSSSCAVRHSIPCGHGISNGMVSHAACSSRMEW